MVLLCFCCLPAWFLDNCFGNHNWFHCCVSATSYFLVMRMTDLLKVSALQYTFIHRRPIEHLPGSGGHCHLQLCCFVSFQFLRVWTSASIWPTLLKWMQLFNGTRRLHPSWGLGISVVRLSTLHSSAEPSPFTVSSPISSTAPKTRSQNSSKCDVEREIELKRYVRRS